jgi:hypothetical protein
MDTFLPDSDDLSAANEQLRRMLADAISPGDLAGLSNAELELLLASVPDATLGEEQIELILSKVGAKIHAAEQSSAVAVPASPSPPLPLEEGQGVGNVAPASPVLGFLGNISGLNTLGNYTLWSLLAVVVGLTLTLLFVLATGFPGGAKRPEIAGVRRGSPDPAESAGDLRSSQGPGRETMPQPPAPIVATITRMVDCRCSPRSTLARLRDCVAVGREFDLDAGLLEITYDTGARVILHGPASYKVQTNNSGFLAYGDLTGVVEKLPGAAAAAAAEHDLFGCRPPLADPPLFTVHTPEANVTDLGTEFGVRVGRAGRTESHVFRGKVKVGVATTPSQDAAADDHEIVLNANESIRVEKRAGETPLMIVREGGKGLADFVRESEFEPGQVKDTAEPHPPQAAELFVRWQGFSAKLRKRDDLLAYYDFQRDNVSGTLRVPSASGTRSVPDTDGGVLRNRAPSGKPFDGQLLGGAAWTAGRYPGKQALKFAAPKSGVRIDLPAECRQITLVASVQIDRLGPLNSLLHSDSWDRAGQFAWQINHGGLNSIGIRNGVFDRTRREREQEMAWPRAGIARERLAAWCQLAVTYDSAVGRARFYLDGNQLADLPIATHQPVRLGPAVIGSHLADSSDAHPGDRTLPGRMDELMIFNRALSASEIAALYRQEAE